MHIFVFNSVLKLSDSRWRYIGKYKLNHILTFCYLVIGSLGGEEKGCTIRNISVNHAQDDGVYKVWGQNVTYFTCIQMS